MRAARLWQLARVDSGSISTANGWATASAATWDKVELWARYPCSLTMRGSDYSKAACVSRGRRGEQQKSELA